MRRPVARAKIDTRQASLFDDEPPVEASVTIDEPTGDADEAPAWIEADELQWLDAVRLPPLDADAALRVAATVETVETVAAVADNPSPAPLADCVVWLERNYRFGLDSPIGRLSLAIRRGAVQEALDALPASDAAAASFHEDAGDMLATSTIERLAQRFSAYLDALRDALAAPRRTRCRCSTRSTGSGSCARRAAGRAAPSTSMRSSRRTCAVPRVPLAVGAHWFTGRPVMVTRNDYALGLFNGDIGIALPDVQGRCASGSGVRTARCARCRRRRYRRTRRRSR